MYSEVKSYTVRVGRVDIGIRRASDTDHCVVVPGWMAKPAYSPPEATTGDMIQQILDALDEREAELHELREKFTDALAAYELTGELVL